MRGFWFSLVLLHLLTISTIRAQVPPDLETLLRWQDDMVVEYSRRRAPADFRYRDVLTRVTSRLNPHMQAIYGKVPDPVRYYVFQGGLGFNAQAWHRVIIMDGLLLDGLRHLSQGVTVHHGTDNKYVHELARHVSRAHMACLLGVAISDPTLQHNPFSLPSLWGLPPPQRDAADALFEEMVAAWVAHEVSHVYMNHARERAEHRRLADFYRTQGSLRMPVDLTALDRRKELEADERAARLLLQAGYGVEGMIRSIEFVEQVEGLIGTLHDPNRSHPLPADRIATVRAVQQEADRK